MVPWGPKRQTRLSDFHFNLCFFTFWATPEFGFSAQCWAALKWWLDVFRILFLPLWQTIFSFTYNICITMCVCVLIKWAKNSRKDHSVMPENMWVSPGVTSVSVFFSHSETPGSCLQRGNSVISFRVWGETFVCFDCRQEVSRSTIHHSLRAPSLLI